MAKGNMLLGYARGKVGDLVFTRRNGEQVTRPRVRVVNNPKTEGQMIQRMIFASVIAAYSRMKSICDHSFEGVNYGADSQAKFMSENLKRLRAYYPKYRDPNNKPIDSMAFVLPNDAAMAGAGLIIARGSIPAPEAQVDDESGVLFGFGDGADENQSTSGVLKGLGAMPGDQITACALRDIGNGYTFAKSRYVVKADATANELEGAWNSNGTGSVFDADKTEVDPDVTIVVGGISIGNPIRVSNLKEDIVAAAIIISRKEGEKWLRSDAILYNATDEGAFYSADYALHYWQFSGTDIVTDDTHYLNNADI